MVRRRRWAGGPAWPLVFCLIAAVGGEILWSGEPPDVGSVSVETFCNASALVLVRSRPVAMNGGELSFILSPLHTPALAVLHSEENQALGLGVDCERLSQLLIRSLLVRNGTVGAGIVFEGVNEFVKERLGEPFGGSTRSPLLLPQLDPALDTIIYHNYSSFTWAVEEARRDENGDVRVTFAGSAYAAKISAVVSHAEYESSGIAIPPGSMRLTFEYDRAAMRSMEDSYFAPQFFLTSSLIRQKFELSRVTASTDYRHPLLFSYTVGLSDTDDDDVLSDYVVWPNLAMSGSSRVLATQSELNSSALADYSLASLFLGSLSAGRAYRSAMSLQQPAQYEDGTERCELVVGFGEPVVGAMPDSSKLVGILCVSLPLATALLGGLVSYGLLRRRKAAVRAPDGINSAARDFRRTYY